MLYLYDKAICQDLNKSFNPDNVPNPTVRAIDPEGAINIAAQINNDEITYPIAVFKRSDDIVIDKQRYNFTRAKKGVPVGIDNETNQMLIEKVIPIQLHYDLHVLTTNRADMDEIIKELLFKYTEMYFLSIILPYELKRKVRFGIKLDPDADISVKSGQYNYLTVGTLYECVLPLDCEGAVLVSYDTSHLSRTTTELELQ